MVTESVVSYFVGMYILWKKDQSTLVKTLKCMYNGAKLPIFFSLQGRLLLGEHGELISAISCKNHDS